MKVRYILVTLFILIVYSLVLSRLYYLQVIKGQKYFEASINNYLRKEILYPPRGSIITSDGVKIATDIPTYSLYVDPQEIRDKDNLLKLAKAFKEVFNEDVYNILKANKNSAYPIKVLDDLTSQDIEKFYNNIYEFPGSFIETIPKRYYPYGSIYGHITGYVGYPLQKDFEKYKIGPQSLIGKAGLEKTFNEYLLGKLGYKYIMVNALGKEIKTVKMKEPEKGDDVYLTINSKIQEIVHKVFLESGQKAGAVIVLDPSTGKILALDSFPEYDPNVIYQEWDKLVNDPLKPFLNRATIGIYPPGSVFKIPIALEALKIGAITPNTVLDCPGSLKVGNHVFKNWYKPGFGPETIDQAIQNSCDTFFYQLGIKLGYKNIYNAAKAFSYGSPLPFELTNSKGFLPTPSWKLKHFHQPWFEGDTVNMSIGQGYVLATLLQQTVMMEGIVNNGVIYKPTLLDKIVSRDGKLIFKNERKVLSFVKAPLEDYAIIKKGLREVVLKGTGTNAISSIVAIAGKTGTAQVVFGKKDTINGPWKYRPEAWFVCFAPYRDPKYVVGVIVEHGIEGNLTAAPIAKRILEQIYIQGLNRKL